MSESNLTKIEEQIQKFWEDNNILEKSLESRRRKKKFIFYEGPPTANGLPHIGHFLTRAFKDLFIRYKVMAGFFVSRRAGWDTHGLAVEIEVEKELGLKSKKEIEKYGIAKFNKKAKESAQKYKTEWEKFSKRIGFWLDFENPYITYANNYIERLWQVIKQFDKKKFLYQGYKVLPWCPRCGTVLSSHEVALGYETITENSVIVKFPLRLTNNDISLKVSRPNFKKTKTYILSWTTTPWTLPGNVALAVGKNIKYQILNIKNKDERYILAKDRVSEVIKEVYEVIDEIEGKSLIGLEYEPLFEIKKLKSEKSYKIYPADFVSTKEGTGVVHTAVMYGEDDYQLGEKVGLPKHHTVDKEGKFKSDISVFRNIGIAGQFVKDAEKEIIDYLKEKNLLFKVEPYSHEYPHCWRCKTPLLYYATDSWFVKTTAVKKQLLANNKKINWVPSYIKEGRFGQWLKEVKDWAFSRNRFWGTPLPVWQCKECKSSLVIDSLEELDKNRYQKSNQYFAARHAESEKNDFKGKEINSTKLENDKYDLTEKGIKQAEGLAKILKNKKIDLIFSSPFLRAKRTAQIIGKELNLEVKIDNRLKEMDHGSICEGKDYYTCVPKEEYPNMDFYTKFGLDGESRNEVRERIFDFIKEIDAKHEDKKILIISHGDPLWLMEGISRNISEEDLFLAKKNQLFKLKGQKFELFKLGESRIVKFDNYPRDEYGNLDLHRPYIDEVHLKCPECGGQMKRVQEVVDVWFDSGAMPFAQSANSKFRNIDISSLDFPADFITEGVDQTRGWFYTLLAVSTLLGFGPPYKNVISLGHVLDKEGKKMSKSVGNVIKPDYAIEKFGADAVRWWFYRVNPAGEPKSFREEELKDINNGFVRVILNCLRFWQLYQDDSDDSKTKDQRQKLNFHSIDLKELALLDQWLLSKWNSLIVSVTESLDRYDATLASREIEKFAVEDLSNWWIRRSRDKFSRFAFANRGPSMAKPSGQLENESYQSELLRFILLELAKSIAPFTPFLSEYLHEELHHGIKPGVVSIHFHDWPEANKKLIDKKLEGEMNLARKIVSLGLAARKDAGIKVRQPLAKLEVSAFKSLKISEELLSLIKEEVNVKNVVLEKGDKEELSVVLDSEITPALRAESWIREFIRIIQGARRDAGYDYNEKVNAFWFSEDKFLSEAVKREAEFIKQKTGLKELGEFRYTPHLRASEGHGPKFVYDIEKEQELESGRKIWLGLKK